MAKNKQLEEQQLTSKWHLQARDWGHICNAMDKMPNPVLGRKNNTKQKNQKQVKTQFLVVLSYIHPARDISWQYKMQKATPLVYMTYTEFPIDGST